MGYKMIGEHWYYKSIKKVIAVFASLMSDVCVKTGDDKIISVPIHFSQKQKFIEALLNNEDVRNMYTDIAMPVMGFEIVNYAYAPERMTNPINIQNVKINKDDGDLLLTSIPYSIGIELYVITETLDQGFQILEQIIPFFTPQLTITFKDVDLHNINTNITFDMTAVSQDVQYEDTFDTKRMIQFNYSFIAHTKFHSNPRTMQRIKDVIINMKESDHDQVFDKLVGHRIGNTNEFEWTK